MEQLNQHQKRRQRLENRNKAVLNEYNKLSGKKHNGIRIFTEEVKIHMLADQFFLSEKTIEDIVYNRLKYGNE
jgi:hypothetical protein